MGKGLVRNPQPAVDPDVGGGGGGEEGGKP